MLDKRTARLEEIEKRIDESLKAHQRQRIKVVEPPKPPKGDPEASLRGPFQSIRSQLDVAPARMDERGRSFENIGQSDFMPYEQPSVPRFEDVQKRNYVEADLDPKEKIWKELISNEPEIVKRPEYANQLRNYFDARWEQAEGTASGKQMQSNLPMKERMKSRDETGVTTGYINEMAFKKFAEPYDKAIQASRPIGAKAGVPFIDDAIQKHFEGEGVGLPGQILQRKMYKGRPSYDEEMAKIARESEPQKFGKTKEALKGSAPKGRLRVIKVSDGKDVTDAFGTTENLADLTVEELQKIVDSTGKRYRVEQAGEHVPSGSKNTQGNYSIKDWAGNTIDELGTYDTWDEGWEELENWLRAKGLNDDELDEALQDYEVMHKSGSAFYNKKKGG
jgi:hypothetical protein